MIFFNVIFVEKIKKVKSILCLFQYHFNVYWPIKATTFKGNSSVGYYVKMTHISALAKADCITNTKYNKTILYNF
jgi:hypothetical protein